MWLSLRFPAPLLMSEQIEDLLSMSVEQLRGAIVQVQSMMEFLLSKGCRLSSLLAPLLEQLEQYEFVLKMKESDD